MMPGWSGSLALLRRPILSGVAAIGLLCSGWVCAANYQIGVYYFPGWKDKQIGAPSDFPWEPIKAFPEREPLLGWYDEGSDAVMRQQLTWMRTYGIDYVVFDWYFSINDKLQLEHALAAYLRAPNRDQVKFSLLWANHDKVPKNMANWEAMVRYWVKNYFFRPEFLRANGKPVVFVFSAHHLMTHAATFGATAKNLLDKAQVIARAAGLPGINFVAGAGATVPIISSTAKATGYQAFSAYNYHHGPDKTRPSHNYAELDEGYREHWKRFAAQGNLPLVVPMTSGWDNRPWGGSKDLLHDNSSSTPEEFRKHLQAAKSFMDANPALTGRTGVICCWNEYGEGSFIEPTKAMGFRYLEQVLKTFGNP